ncbi:MAG: carbamoyltransferase HypF, partial [Sciscionella sp.]
CPACGPTLSLADGARQPLTGDPIGGTVELLLAGKVLAIKGLGGYHLAVDATSERASARLRTLKHREDKPFAVMISTVEKVRESCAVDPTGERLLTGRRRPIVLLDRHQDAPIAPSVAPGNRQLGVMLPYTPLHHLLLAAFRRPLVLTSGNISDEPIAFTDDDAFDRLGRIADAFLTHDRAIHIRTDDSVTRSFRGAELPVRRSRGYTPEPLSLPWQFPRPVLACGAELKNTFCVARGSHAFLSHHIGDLENYETLRSFIEGIEHFKRLFDIEPAVVGYDLHPEYLSTKYALEQDSLDLVGVQHHHAHIASCLADNAVDGPVLGVAFDGTGYGTDGTIWGGEFLLADLTGFTRQAYLAPLPLPGGAQAIREPWRMAASYVDSALGETPERLEVFRRNEKRWHQVTELARGGMNAPLTSSAGRLFDAVAALLGIRDAVNYEGQAAIELEQLADIGERGSYPVPLSGEAVPGADVVRCVIEDLLSGVTVPVIAARFHNTMVDVVTGVCRRLREITKVHTVALSGGVFQNLLLLDRVVEALQHNGFS